MITPKEFIFFNKRVCKRLPIYFPVSSSSPLFLNLLSFLADGGSGVFLPPLPFPADLARSPPFLSPLPPFPAALLGPSPADYTVFHTYTFFPFFFIIKVQKFMYRLYS